ncbi:MAG: TldD/PmbA family protein [Xanthomonadaceae bacterium]|nr:TldD/PmbA family protein [Xanthomonadaceae bacterium]
MTRGVPAGPSEGRNCWPLDQHESEVLVETAQWLLGQARQRGAEQAAFTIVSALERTVHARGGVATQVEQARPRHIQLTVYTGSACGVSSTTDLDRSALLEALEHAMAIARYARPDVHAGLPPATLLASDQTDLDLWHPCDLEPSTLAERALAMEQSVVDTGSSFCEAAVVGFRAEISIHANSLGFVGTHATTTFLQHCIAVARDQQGMQRGWDWDQQCQWPLLSSAEQVGRQAAQRAVEQLGARPAPAGVVPVLFAPDAAVWLFNHLVEAVKGPRIAGGTSFLAGALDQAVFPDAVRIEEQPRLPRALASRNFDDEGVATRELPLIVDGRLVRFMLDCRSASRLEMESTGNAGEARNLVILPGTKSRSELVAGMSRGLLVTDLLGHDADLISGEYSRGVSGFWIENGEVAYPVQATTIAGNLREMFSRVQTVGRDVESRRWIHTPSVLIDGMTVASGR